MKTILPLQLLFAPDKGDPSLMVNAPSAFHSAVGGLLSESSGTFALMWCVGKGADQLTSLLGGILNAPAGHAG